MGHYLFRRQSRNLNLVGHASCRIYRQGEETPLHLLIRCDAVMTKSFKSLGQHQTRTKEIPNLEVTQILKYYYSWVERIENLNPRRGGNVYLDRSNCARYPNVKIQYNTQ